jgi:hypothetical protein
MAAKQAVRKDEGKASESVRWRLSVKELAVKAGLATPVDSSLAHLDANRRTERFLRASDRRRALEKAKPNSRAAQRAVVREAQRKGQLLRHARLHADPSALMAALGQSSMTDAMERLEVTPTGSPDTDTRRTDTVDTRRPDTDTDTAVSGLWAELDGAGRTLIPAQTTVDTAWTRSADTAGGHGADTVQGSGHVQVKSVDTGWTRSMDTVRGHGADTADTVGGHGGHGVSGHGGHAMDTEPVSIVPAVSADPDDRTDEALLARLLAEVPVNTDGTVSVRRVKDTLRVSTVRAQRLIAAAQMLPDPPANPLTDTAEIPAVTDAFDVVEVVNGFDRQV